MPKMMRAVIVDDERLARQRLARLLEDESDVALVGQCKNAQEARALLTAGAADVLFVDIRMPRTSGFELLSSLAVATPPAVVFVTAFEQYAVQAFDVHACDYLLKPVEESRLRVAVQRVRAQLARRDGQDVAAPAPTPAHIEREQTVRALKDEPRSDAVLVPLDARVLRVHLDAIDWIEAAGNYVQLHVGQQVHLLRETIAAFEARLAPTRFARIHRTVIVNVERIVAFEPTLSGDFLVTLRSGTQLRMSRTYRGRIRDLFGHSV